MNAKGIAVVLAFVATLVSQDVGFAQTTPPSAAKMSAEQAREENAYAIGLQAFLWGYPLRYYALSSPKAVAAGGAYLNEFRKYPELKTAKEVRLLISTMSPGTAPR